MKTSLNAVCRNNNDKPLIGATTVLFLNPTLENSGDEEKMNLKGQYTILRL